VTRGTGDAGRHEHVEVDEEQAGKRRREYENEEDEHTMSFHLYTKVCSYII
jgi:hypothetical protein